LVLSAGSVMDFTAAMADTLKGRDVIFAFDKDTAGKAGATRAGNLLHGKAKSVKTIQWPDCLTGAKDCKDASDFFGLGKTAADFQALVDAAVEYVPEHVPAISDAVITGDYYDYSVKPPKFLPPRLGNELMKEFSFINSGGLLYVYHNGVYIPEAIDFIKLECRKRLGDNAKKAHVSEVIAHIEDLTTIKPDSLNPRAELINLDNGMLDFMTGELLTYNKDYLSTIRIPIVYDIKAECPGIDKFLATTLSPNCIPLIEEMLGYCLVSVVRYEKAFMLTGTGANGKSTLLTLLEAFIGQFNVSKIPLQEIADNRFKRADLLGKLVNIFADLPSTPLESTSYLKAIVSGDHIDCERKHKDPFFFRPFARLIFSANEIPKSRDKTHAFYRRWVVIPFEKRFEGTNADRSLASKLTTPEELSGLLNRALSGLRRLFDNDAFSENEHTRRAMAEYKKQNDSVEAFISECCTLGAGEVQKDTLYGAYKGFCEEQGFKQPVIRRTCYDRIRSTVGVGERKSMGIRFFTGIKANDQ
ncbi:MAG: hypothetical protein HQK96_17590, partial [Nitrospirae bacterium]|nr:hypothetical protein [Nitrospirota bacterium]